MKKEEKLPLIFKYLEKISKGVNDNDLKNITYYLKSNQLQTNCYERKKPIKPLIRLL